MITLSKASSAPEFCHLQGDCRINGGQPGSVSVKLTPLGQIIRKEITAIPDLEPAVRILQFSIMPDHAHILLFVQRYISEALGTIIARFKIKIKEASGIAPVFEENFNDQILTKDRSLSTLFSYIRENPLRLAVRRQFPEYFRRVNNLVIDGISYQAYGNFQLLENPFKKQVIVHRADSDAIIAGNFARWRYTAVNGGVLISPFISKAEKDVRTDAEALGGRTILIINELMGEPLQACRPRFPPMRIRKATHYLRRHFWPALAPNLPFHEPPRPKDSYRQAVKANARAKALSANRFDNKTSTGSQKCSQPAPAS